jgi:hypothetical protein
MWKCVEIGDKSYLASQMSIECYESPVHQEYLVYSVVCMLVYVLGIPIAMFAILFRARYDIQHHPEDLATKMKYGMLYSSYEPDYYYFEVVEMGRKLMMTGGLILVGSGSALQVLIGILVCFVHILIIFYTRPYVEDTEDKLVQVTSTQLFLVLLCGMFLLASNENDGMVDAVLISLFVVCLLCIVAALVYTIMDDGFLYALCGGPIFIASKLAAMCKKNRKANGTNGTSKAVHPASPASGTATTPSETDMRKLRKASRAFGEAPATQTNDDVTMVVPMA